MSQTINNTILELFTNQANQVQSVGNDFRLQVSDAYPSIYTKDDVIRLLDNVIGKYVAMLHDFADDVTDVIPSELEPNTQELTLEAIDNMYDVIEGTLETYYESDIEADNDSAELSLDYNNRVSVDHISFEFDTSSMTDRIINKLKQTLIEKKKTEQENN